MSWGNPKGCREGTEAATKCGDDKKTVLYESHWMILFQWLRSCYEILRDRCMVVILVSRLKLFCLLLGSGVRTPESRTNSGSEL